MEGSSRCWNWMIDGIGLFYLITCSSIHILHATLIQKSIFQNGRIYSNKMLKYITYLYINGNLVLED